MTVISQRIFRPNPGQSAVTLGRLQRLAAILNRAGGHTRLANVLWGDGARDYHLYAAFENVAAGAKASAAMQADPEMVALAAEVAAAPSAHWEGPDVLRVIFGEPKPDMPVLMQREYAVERDNLPDLVALLPEVQELRPEMPIIGAVPSVSGDMGRLIVGYYAPTLVALGEAMDEVGPSDAFQGLLVDAAQFGTLTTSRVLVNV